MRISRLLIGAAAIGLVGTLDAIPAHALLLWGNSASGSNYIEAFDPNAGFSLVHQFHANPAGNGRGVVTVGNTVFYTIVGDGHIYELNATTGAPTGSIALAGATSLATIAYDGTNFWVGDYSGTNHAYEYSMSGTLLKTVTLNNCSSFCDGLEYFTDPITGQGRLISNRYDGGLGGANTYDVYDTNGNLLHAGLITGQDTTGNTGIAFNGTDFFISNIFDNSVSEYDINGNLLGTFTLGGPQPPGGRFLEDLSFDYSAVLTPTPEPSSLALIASALLGLGLVFRRRRAS